MQAPFLCTQTDLAVAPEIVTVGGAATREGQREPLGAFAAGYKETIVLGPKEQKLTEVSISISNQMLATRLSQHPKHLPQSPGSSQYFSPLP